MADNVIPRLGRSAFSVVSLRDSDNDLEYWLSRTPAERLTPIEVNRRMVYGHDLATSRLQRLFEIAELPTLNFGRDAVAGPADLPEGEMTDDQHHNSMSG